MGIGFDILAARQKREGEDDSPSVVPMRAGISPADQRKPSSDQKKVRRLQTIKTAGVDVDPALDSLTEAEEIAPPLIQESDAWTRDEGTTQGWEHPLTAHKENTTMDATGQERYAALNDQESVLIRALGERRPAAEARVLAEELEVVRAQRRAVLASMQDILLEDAFITPATTPVVPFARTSAQTDWMLDEPDTPIEANVTQAMRAEASAWFGRVHPAVKADADEYAEQARGMARRTAGQYGLQGAEAERAFMDTAMFLQKRAEGEGTAPGGTTELSGPLVENQDGVHPPMPGAGGGDQGQDPGSNQADEPSMVNDPQGINASRRAEYERFRVHADDLGAGEKSRNCTNGNHSDCGGGSCSCSCHQGSSSGACADGDHDECQMTHGPGKDDCNCKTCRNKTASRANFLGPQHGSLLSRAASMHLADNDFPVHDQAGHGETSLPTRNPADDKEVLDNFVPEPVADGIHPEMPGAPEQSADPNQANDGTTVGTLQRMSDGSIWDVRVVNGQKIARFVRAAEGEGGSTCATCGAAIERDPEGEEPRTWHHNDGASHDHEAKPKEGTEASRRTAGEVPEAFKEQWKKKDGDDGDADDKKPDFLEDKEGNLYRRVTAGIYCNTHQVWVGDGNADTHAGCKKEQRATEKTKEAAGTDNFGGKQAPPFGSDGKPVEDDDGDDGSKTANHRVARIDYGVTLDQHFAKLAADSDQNGQGASSLEPVEVMDNLDEMWPWELDEEGKKKGESAADVASVPTPGGSSGYPQPTASLTPQQAAFRQRVQAGLLTTAKP
jgi:hypothetical protein